MLEFRPHHFLCTLGFEGKGYSADFVRGFRAIADSLRATHGAGDALEIRITAATDSICSPCPNRRGSVCETESRIQDLDRGHAAVLGIAAGQTLTWKQAKTLIAEKMTDADFDRVCAPCSWRPMGVCKAALQRLRQERSRPITLGMLMAFGTLLALAPAFSAHASLVRESDDGPNRPRPLELVRSELVKKHRSKPARTLKKAWEALQARKYPQAVSLATPVARDALFGDYGNWIVASAQYGAGLKALADKKFAEAVKNAESASAASFKIEARSPYSPMLKYLSRDVGLAEVLQGDAYGAQKKWKRATRLFEQGFQRLSNGNAMGLVRPESLQRYARACSVIKGEMCDAWILRFSFFYPKTSEEMRAITQVLPDASEHPRPAFVGRLNQSYKAPDLDQTAFEQSMGLYLDGKFSAAIRSLQQFVDEFPRSPFRFRVRYWLAQAMTHEQQHDKAQQSYESLQHDSPLTYYGLLAAFAAGHNMDAPIDSTMPLVTDRDPLLQAPELLHIQRTEQFISEGALDLAAMELKAFRSRDALSSPFLMYLAALATEAHTYTTAFNILSDLIARGYDGATSSQFLAMIFPLEHLDDIKKVAATIDIDPVLVLSLVKQESAFDQGAISSSGALGLMQLMPATASDTEPSVQRADLVEAATNLRVGTKYLKHLLTRFNGNVVLALAGYNAGPNAADRWFKEQGGKRGMVDFIETIPYKETREYVSSIIRNYYWYSRKLNPAEPAKALSYFWNIYGPPGSAAFVPAPDTTPSAIQASPAPSPSPSADAGPAPALLPED